MEKSVYIFQLLSNIKWLPFWDTVYINACIIINDNVKHRTTGYSGSRRYDYDTSMDSVTRRNAKHRTAIPPARRRHLRTCGKNQHGSNCLPQALALLTCFRDVFVERKDLAVRCVSCVAKYVIVETMRQSRTDSAVVDEFSTLSRAHDKQSI